VLIAGPCAIESKEQAIRIAEFVKECGATIFRGGCWKGQNYPVVNGKLAYWGLGDEAARLMFTEIKCMVGMKIVTEVQSIEQAKLVTSLPFEYIQIGARNMQNFPLLRWLEERTRNLTTRFILKRGLGNTTDEWLGSAEHLDGVDRVILCERGVSHFDRTITTRWRLDFVAVAYIKEYTRYKVIVDPSHGSGDRNLVERLSHAALAIADGLMLEVHYDPNSSPTDARQTINFPTFKRIAEAYKKRKKR
jgi:3-deoxy-7-phosphoheptulonate synthase